MYKTFEKETIRYDYLPTVSALLSLKVSGDGEDREARMRERRGCKGCEGWRRVV